MIHRRRLTVGVVLLLSGMLLPATVTLIDLGKDLSEMVQAGSFLVALVAILTGLGLIFSEVMRTR